MSLFSIYIIVSAFDVLSVVADHACRESPLSIPCARHADRTEPTYPLHNSGMLREGCPGNNS